MGDVGLTLTDVAIRNGKSASDLGPTVGGCSICGAAAIDNDGGNLVVNNAIFANNTEGGAIFTDAALEAVTTATITNSSFFRNSAHGSGAAINNAMTMTVTDSTFSDNSALAPYSYNYGDGEGGAIFNYGTLTVNSSTFSKNSASGDPIRNGQGYGGAIANEATLTVNSSTFSGNQADNGAGIYNIGSAAVSNSTISGNVATAGGGGIYNPGILTVTNSTVVSNVGGSGAGGIDNTGTIKVSLGSSIVSGNIGTDLLGNFKSLGYNVIGSTLGATITGVNASNLTNTAAAPLNLGALASNGGTTKTILIGAGSVAIGSGNCTSMTGMTPVATDQRGSPRKSTCDVGAYET